MTKVAEQVVLQDRGRDLGGVVDARRGGQGGQSNRKTLTLRRRLAG